MHVTCVTVSLDKLEPKRVRGRLSHNMAAVFVNTKSHFGLKADAVGIPLWIISLDYRVHWPALWTALVDERIPVHLVWILQLVCILDNVVKLWVTWGKAESSNITGGVRQGCVLSPRLFCAVLQWAMREWRAEVGNMGFNLMDGGPDLLDLRFADDILIFAQSRVEAGNLLDALVKQLDRVASKPGIDNGHHK